MTPSLPRDDARPDARARQLAESREAYAFAYDWPAGVATCAELPRSDEYSLAFTAHALRAYVEIGANLAAMTVEGFGGVGRMIEERLADLAPHELHEHLFTLPADLARQMPHRWASSWREFEDLFCVWKAPDVVGFFDRGDEATDLAFAWQRVAGFNPMTLARCAALPDNFPVTEALFARVVGEGDTLAAAAAEGRLYLADYAALDGLATGVTDGIQKFLCAPLALFVVDRSSRDLRPVAIQCGQAPGADNPVLCPEDGWRWKMARTFVQIADANVHEAVVHLGRTHLVMEAVTVAMRRQLAAAHPLHVLLDAHVETTLAINHSAKTSLIAPGGVVDRCFAGDIEALCGVIRGGLAGYRLDETAPADDLRARGVDDAAALPTYPYRDDALPLWGAIADFVREYVGLYYTSAADVAGDVELAAFVRELGAESGGRLAGVPSVATVEELVFLLTRILFIAGPQHSAVNFTQFPFMGFPPNTPGAGYRAAPDPSTPDAESAYTAMLPPWRIAIESSVMVYLLSNVRSSRLGHYGPTHFRDLRVLPVVHRFQAALDAIEGATARRDRSRLLSYPHLRPSLVLQSISI